MDGFVALLANMKISSHFLSGPSRFGRIHIALSVRNKIKFMRISKGVFAQFFAESRFGRGTKIMP